MKYEVNVTGKNNFFYFSNKRQAIIFARNLAKINQSKVVVNIEDSLWEPFTSKTNIFYSQFISIYNISANKTAIYRHSGGGLVSVNRDGNFTY